jgi:hypothetical protein
LAPLKEVKRDPNVLLGEILSYLRFSYLPSSKYSGTALFEVPKTDVNERLIFWIRCDPKAPVETGFGMPPDGKYSVWTTMSRDDFFYLYSGDAGPGAVATMLLTGRLTVQWLNFSALKSFAASFDYSNTNWVAFYKAHDMPVEVARMMRLQWSRADARGPYAVVTDDGSIVVDESITPEARNLLRAPWHPAKDAGIETAPAAEATTPASEATEPAAGVTAAPASEVTAPSDEVAAPATDVKTADAEVDQGAAPPTTEAEDTAKADVNATAPSTASAEIDFAISVEAGDTAPPSTANPDAVGDDVTPELVEEVTQYTVLRDVPFLADFALRATLASASDRFEGGEPADATAAVPPLALQARSRYEEFGVELLTLLPDLLRAPRAVTRFGETTAASQSLLNSLAMAAPTDSFAVEVNALVERLEQSLVEAATVDRIRAMLDASQPTVASQSLFSPSKVVSAAGSVIESVGVFARELIDSATTSRPSPTDAGATTATHPDTAVLAALPSDAMLIVMNQFRIAQDAASVAAKSLRELLAEARRIRTLGRTLANLALGGGSSLSRLAMLTHAHNMLTDSGPSFAESALCANFSLYSFADVRDRPTETASASPNADSLSLALSGLAQARALCGVPGADGACAGVTDSARARLPPELLWATAAAPAHTAALFRQALPIARINIRNDAAPTEVRERLQRAAARNELGTPPTRKKLPLTLRCTDEASAPAFGGDVFGFRGAHAQSASVSGTVMEPMDDASAAASLMERENEASSARVGDDEEQLASGASAYVDSVAARWHAAHGTHSPLSPIASLVSLRKLHSGLLWLPVFSTGGSHEETPPMPHSLLSPDALATLAAWAHAGNGAARVLSAQAFETLAWSLGAGARPFARAPLTLDAIEQGSSAVLVPAWRTRRLLFHADSAGAPDTASRLRSPTLRARPRTIPPRIYDGWGSGLFFDTARARVELTLADSTDAARTRSEPLSFFSSIARVVQHFARGSTLSKYVGGDNDD